MRDGSVSTVATISVYAELTRSELTGDDTDSLIVQELGAQHVGLGHVLLLSPELPSRTDRPVSSLVGIDDSARPHVK